MKPTVAQKVIPGAFPRRSLEYQKEHLTVAKEVGDRAGECKAYENLGNACRLQGYAKAIEYHTQCLAIAKEVGPGGGVKGVREPRHLVSVAGGLCKGHRVPQAVPSDCQGGGRPGGGGQERWRYGSLGISYQSQGGFAKAIEYHTQHLEIAKEVGDRSGEGKANRSLGNVYLSQGDFAKAIEYHTQQLAIANEVGDRAGAGEAYGNLGSAYQLQGDFADAIEYYTQCLAIAEEVGDRAGEGRTYGNLGTRHMHLNEVSLAEPAKKLSTPHGSQGTQAYKGADVVSGGLPRTRRATFRVLGRPGRLAVAGARARNRPKTARDAPRWHPAHGRPIL